MFLNNKFRYFIVLFTSFIFLLSGFGFSFAKEDLFEPSISTVPEPEFNTIEDYLYITGRSNSNAIITVMLEKQGNPDKPVKFIGNADSMGEWVVTGKVFLSAGDWKVVARQQVGSDVSGWSNPRIIRSVVNGINIFGLQIRYVFLALVLLCFFIILMSVYIYFKRKIFAIKKDLREKRFKDAEDRFHRGFSEVRKDLMDQLKDLAQESQGRPLNPSEIEKRNKILEEIDNIERGLDHDIGDLK